MYLPWKVRRSSVHALMMTSTASWKRLAAGVDVDADAVEFLLLVAGTDAEVDTAVADDVQHGDFLGDEDGVVQGQDDYGGADADVLGASGDGAEERPDAGEQAVAGKAMLAKPGFIEAGLVGEGDLLQGIVEGLGRREVLVIGDDSEDSELHGSLLLRDCVVDGRNCITRGFVLQGYTGLTGFCAPGCRVGGVVAPLPRVQP